MERWKDRMFRFFCAALHRAADAEELAAETMVRAWKGLADLEDPRLFAPWLHRIAWNVLRNHVRDRNVRESRVSILGVEILERKSSISDGDDSQDVRDTLAALPAPTERLLRDKYEHGLTYEEIAARDDVSIWVVKDRLREARSQLERLLSRRGLLDPEAGPRGGPAMTGGPEAPLGL